MLVEKELRPDVYVGRMRVFLMSLVANRCHNLQTRAASGPQEPGMINGVDSTPGSAPESYIRYADYA